jgi:hypothetical protein
VTYLIEYLGEFDFIFETFLDYESGDQMGSFAAKKPPSKISCLGTFKWTAAADGKESVSPLPPPTYALNVNFHLGKKYKKGKRKTGRNVKEKGRKKEEYARTEVHCKAEDSLNPNPSGWAAIWLPNKMA